jgi:hypothetical protein
MVAPLDAGVKRDEHPSPDVRERSLVARDEHPSPDVRFGGVPPRGVQGVVKDVDENKGVAGASVRAQVCKLLKRKEMVGGSFGAPLETRGKLGKGSRAGSAGFDPSRLRVKVHKEL